MELPPSIILPEVSAAHHRLLLSCISIYLVVRIVSTYLLVLVCRTSTCVVNTSTQPLALSPKLREEKPRNAKERKQRLFLGSSGGGSVVCGITFLVRPWGSPRKRTEYKAERFARTKTHSYAPTTTVRIKAHAPTCVAKRFLAKRRLEICAAPSVQFLPF